MNTMDENVLSSDEIDILQEIMNIAFGRAASDLAEVIDIYIRLSVPYIHLLDTAKLSGYIKDEIKEDHRVVVWVKKSAN